MFRTSLSWNVLTTCYASSPWRREGARDCVQPRTLKDPREIGKSFQIHLQIASAEIGQLLPVFDRNCAGWHLCSSSVIRPLLERNDLAGLWKLPYFTQHMLAGGCQSDFYFPENTCMRLQIDRCSVAFNAVAFWTMSITTAPSAINAHPGCSMSSC
jgi:hypothetical protein